MFAYAFIPGRYILQREVWSTVRQPAAKALLDIVLISKNGTMILAIFIGIVLTVWRTVLSPAALICR
jgi:hypothetical protein